jgi:hypothetical protein
MGTMLGIGNIRWCVLNKENRSTFTLVNMRLVVLTRTSVLRNEAKGLAKLLQGILKIQPILYSGIGTHAMYASPGSHHYTKLGPLLGDHTDKGPMWDVTLNYHGYGYSQSSGFNLVNDTFQSSSWLEFVGKWGDKKYKDNDSRQYRLFGEYAWTSGPTGPGAKNLLRKDVCETLSGADCKILTDRNDIYIELNQPWGI